MDNEDVRAVETVLRISPGTRTAEKLATATGRPLGTVQAVLASLVRARRARVVGKAEYGHDVYEPVGE